MHPFLMYNAQHSVHVGAYMYMHSGSDVGVSFTTSCQQILACTYMYVLCGWEKNTRLGIILKIKPVIARTPMAYQNLLAHCCYKLNSITTHYLHNHALILSPSCSLFHAVSNMYMFIRTCILAYMHACTRLHKCSCSVL